MDPISIDVELKDNLSAAIYLLLVERLLRLVLLINETLIVKRS